MLYNDKSGLKFLLDDGGRTSAGFEGWTGDCVTRAVAIATGLPYRQVYDAINELAKDEHHGSRKRGISSARNGVYKTTTRRFIESLGWKWVPTMFIGSGCTVHLKLGEIPSEPIIVSLSKHVCAVIDHTIRDTSDPSRDGTRCVYGYFIKESK